MLPVAIEILEDTVTEQDERFTLLIAIPPGQPLVSTGISQALVTIADNDGESDSSHGNTQVIVRIRIRTNFACASYSLY